MNQLTEYLVSIGLTQDFLALLIFIPVVATLVNVSRYIIGLKTLGIYPAMILAFAYYLTGARYGIILTIIVIVVSILTHNVIKRVRMHYISRTALNYTILTLVMGFFFYLIYKFPFLQFNMDFRNLSPIPVILIATLSDFFIKEYAKRNLFTTTRALLETMVIALIGWAIMRYDNFSTFLINNLWVILILMGVNMIVGQSTNLRLVEYIRFKQIFDNARKPSTK